MDEGEGERGRGQARARASEGEGKRGRGQARARASEGKGYRHETRQGDRNKKWDKETEKIVAAQRARESLHSQGSHTEMRGE